MLPFPLVSNVAAPFTVYAVQTTFLLFPLLISMIANSLLATVSTPTSPHPAPRITSLCIAGIEATDVSSQNCRFHSSSPSFCEAKNQAIALEALAKCQPRCRRRSCGQDGEGSTIRHNPVLSKKVNSPVVKT
jgi:hypothetical protein